MTANSRRLGQTCKSPERLASRERKPPNSSSSEPPRSKPDAKDEWPDEGARGQWTMLLMRGSAAFLASCSAGAGLSSISSETLRDSAYG